MPHTHGGPRVEPRHVTAFAIAWALVACVACGGSGTRQTDTSRNDTTATSQQPSTGVSATPARPTPPAPFERVDKARAAEVASYAHSLVFDTSAAASASTHIPVGARGGGASLYADARWSPEIGAGAIADPDLGRGRIIARVVSTGQRSPFHAPTGVGYLWVDSAGTGPGREKWRAVILSDSGRVAFIGRMYFGTRLFTADAPTRIRAVADSFPNGRCGTHCCYPPVQGVEMTPTLLDRLTAAAHAP